MCCPVSAALGLSLEAALPSVCLMCAEPCQWPQPIRTGASGRQAVLSIALMGRRRSREVKGPTQIS